MKEEVKINKLVNCGKIIIGLLIAIFIMLTIGVSKLYSNDTTTDSDTKETTTQASEYNTDYDVSTFKEISASDIKNETNDKLSVVYVGRSTCSWCAAFLPNLWDAEKDYNFQVLYVDIAKIIDFTNNKVNDQDSYDTMVALTGDKYESYVKENFGSTPMILIMKDNKIINAQTGYSDYETFEKVLTDAGFSKK